MPMKQLTLILMLLFSASIEAVEFKVQQLVSGLGVPWGMTFLSDSEILFTERSGKAGLLSLKDNSVRYISGVPQVLANGQGGLLDVKTQPDYEPGGWIYFTYSKAVQRRGVTVLGRAHLKGDKLTDWQEILVTQSATNTTRHYGSRIVFDDKGFLYFGVGDRGKRPNGQDLSTHAGSIMRILPDGQVPTDNPFVNDKRAKAEIWSYGHRNPQGLAWDNQHKRLYEIEHGPRGGDEINLIIKGQNYGWPVISYGKEYWGPVAVGEGTSKPGMQQPLKYYVPSIAPGSLLYYDGDAFPKWKGNLFAGALKLQHLNRVVLSKQGRPVNEERLLENLGERIRALLQSPEGWIYFSTDSGKIFVIRP
jgi:aldose sugar dehydrogenase